MPRFRKRRRVFRGRARRSFGRSRRRSFGRSRRRSGPMRIGFRM